MTPLPRCARRGPHRSPSHEEEANDELRQSRAVACNLTRDPELRYTPAGTAVCDVGVALNHRWKDQAGEAQQETTFVEVTVWGKQAETVSAYLTKGRAVAIEGRLQQDTWETDAGERRSRLKVVAQRVTFLSSAHGQPAPTGETAPDWVTEEAER